MTSGLTRFAVHGPVVKIFQSCLTREGEGVRSKGKAVRQHIRKFHLENELYVLTLLSQIFLKTFIFILLLRVLPHSFSAFKFSVKGGLFAVVSHNPQWQ